MTNIVQKFILAAAIAAITGSLSLLASGQGTTPPPPPGAKPSKKSDPTATPPAPYEYKYKYSTGGTYEKAIAVAPNVNFTLCVTEGNLKVNSWKRDEVRVYVDGGPKFSFKVIDKPPDGKPVWIQMTNLDPKAGYHSECIWGETIEIDVPAGTSLNLTGKAITAQVDGLRKVGVQTIGGDIAIRNVKEGVKANTYEGDITVDEAWGQVNLETTTGNIVVVDSGPSDIGDTFKAVTRGGAISLTRVTHRQQDVRSVSGSILFNGELKSGGTYAFNTTNGTIRLALPSMTSCKLSATFSVGRFSSDLPFKIETDNIAPANLKTLVGKLGSGGEALLRLSTELGMIDIKKQLASPTK
ncbi:MAG: DUF4097 family beta strand repeat protein [Acidobacteria bacterium]|nr:DUF4097 family beta strand repeat protein [Acidobacteriota bacterium]